MTNTSNCKNLANDKTVHHENESEQKCKTTWYGSFALDEKTIDCGFDDQITNLM